MVAPFTVPEMLYYVSVLLDMRRHSKEYAVDDVNRALEPEALEKLLEGIKAMAARAERKG